MYIAGSITSAHNASRVMKKKVAPNLSYRRNAQPPAHSFPLPYRTRKISTDLYNVTLFIMYIGCYPIPGDLGYKPGQKGDSLALRKKKIGDFIRKGGHIKIGG